MRLFFITLAVAICTFLALILTRFWGLSIPVYEFDHPFYKWENLAQSSFHIKTYRGPTLEFQNLDPKTILWVSTYMSQDQIFFVDPDFNLDHTLNQKFQISSRSRSSDRLALFSRWPHEHLFSELKELNPHFVKLEDLWKQKPSNRFILDIKSNATDVHKQIVELIDRYKTQDRILIQSDYDIIIKSIKDLRPLMTYGTSLSEVTRIKLFLSIYLAPAISIRGDTFIAPLTISKRKIMTEDLIDEMKRRKKHVFIGPVTNPEDYKKAMDLNPDGVIENF